MAISILVGSSCVSSRVKEANLRNETPIEPQSEDPECTDPKPVIGYDFTEKIVRKKKKFEVQPVVLFRSICRGADGQLEVRDEREIQVPSTSAVNQ